ncbi:hypothetical protein PYCCODRAFT_1356535 [Trametes coccinea BRFM310]|uniref:Monopolin complex subunit Csm1/Pcs1 C-terminal domain-containing protein n=1 Tax=Trametes coccinea (strain BRFM310) TaxID=1353009 RepID=A0A1Y2J4K9_TRAC3|nr:hypothetical protein PYCCODRAFT_1356535 [Trametes coccinea BRFM310]
MVDEQPTKKRRKPSEDSEEVVAMPGPPSKTVAKKTGARAEPTTNGTSKSATVKGKARAGPHSKAGKANGMVAEVEEDREEVVELNDDEAPPEPPVQQSARAGSKQPKSNNGSRAPNATRSSKTEEKLAREVENLRAQLERSRETAKERDKLAKQLDEVFRIRNTEPEQILEEYKSQFDENIQRKEALIQELTAQLSKLQSSSKSSKSYTLHFLTREAAEEEKQALREENLRLKEVIKQRDATIASKDKEIQALQENAKVMQKELDAEIERSKSLAARAPAPTAVARQHAPAPNEPRNTPVIRLYEDMTNILVTGVKIDKSPDFPQLDEEILSCIFTYNYQTPDSEDAAFCELLPPLNFSLRNVYELPPGAQPGVSLPRDKLILKVKYEPRDLDKESPDIVERLAFFKDPFMFARDQMTVFLKTLTDTVSGIFEPEGEGDDSGVADQTREVIVVDG